MLSYASADMERKELSEAVLKCMLDMARRMGTYIHELDVDLLLLDIHDFLLSHPPSQVYIS